MLGGECRAQEPERILPDQVELHTLALVGLLAAEGENLTHQISGAFSGTDDFLQVAVHRAIVGDIVECQFTIAENRPQDIIKVMSDSPSEGAARFHLLGPEELLAELFSFGFRLLARRDILRDACQPIADRCAALKGKGASQNPPHLSIRLRHAEFSSTVFTLLELLKPGMHAWPVLGCTASIKSVTSSYKACTERPQICS
jgi:hypothetical protein